MASTNYFIMIVVMSACFLPKTSVYVASYYDARGGMGAGAAGFKKVDNVPIGVAYPLGVVSSVARWFTGKYDVSMQTLSDTGAITGGAVGVAEGGMMIHGAEGYFSPLKTILRLRNQYDAPNNKLLLANLANASKVCNWSNRWTDADKGGMFAVIARGHQGGMMNFAFPSKTPGGPWEVHPVGCDVAGRTLALMMLENVTNIPGKNYSPSAVRATGERNLSNIAGEHVPDAERYAATQKELDQMPNDIMRSLNGEPIRKFGAGVSSINDPGAVVAAIRDQVMSGNLQPTAGAQLFAASNSVNAAELEANIIFSRIVQACVGSGDAACVRNAFMITEAKNRAAVDSAGEASMFQNFMGYAMNTMMFIYIVMCPIILFVVLTMGWAGWKIVTAYLLFAVWINSWLPLDNAIAHYQLQGFTDRMHQLMMTFANSGEPSRVYAPAVINALHDGARDMIATASTLMSAVPLIMLSLLSGSIYGMVQMAQRASMTTKDYVDEDKAAPQLNQSDVIGAARMINNSSAAGPLSGETFAQQVLGNADAANPVAFSLQMNQSAIDSARESIAAKTQMLEGAMDSKNLAVIDEHNMVTQDGLVYTQSMDGNQTVRFAKAGEHALQTGESFTVGANANGNAKVVGAGAKASGTTSDTVTYTDSSGNTHEVKAGTSFADSRQIQTAYGTLNTQRLSHAVNQQLSDAREQMRSVEMATSSSVSHGMSANLNQIGFSSLMSTDRGVAHQQMMAGANAAAQYDQQAGQVLMQAAQSGNASDYFNALSRMESGSHNQQTAALAGFRDFALNNPDTDKAHTYANMAQGALTVMQHSDNLHSSATQQINTPVSAGNAQDVGAYSNPLNAREQIGQVPVGFNAGMAAHDGLSLEDKQKIMAYNQEKIQAMEKHISDTQQAYNSRGAGYQFNDWAGRTSSIYNDMANEAADRGDTFGYVAGKVGAAASLVAAPITALQSSFQGTSRADDILGMNPHTTNDALNESIRQAGAYRETIMQFSSSDMAERAIDGTPIESIIGHPVSVPSSKGHHHGGIALMEQGGAPQDNWQRLGGHANKTTSSGGRSIYDSSDSATPSNLSKRPDIQHRIIELTQEAGLNPNMMLAISDIETGSKFDPNAYNQKSGASGLYQFIPGNFKSYGLSGGKQFDVDANIKAGIKMTKENVEIYVDKFDREPTMGEIYLMHQQGRGGFMKLLHASEHGDASAASVVGYQRILQNLPSSLQDQAKTMKASEFISYWNKVAEDRYKKFE